MGAREDRIARIQRIERIRALEAKNPGSDAGQAELQKLDPPMAADGPIDYAADGINRALSLHIGATKAAVGYPTGLLSGKEAGDALLGGGPTSSKMMERAGVGEGPSLSDLFPSIPKDAKYNMSARGLVGGLVDAFGPNVIGSLKQAVTGGAEKLTARELRAAVANPAAQDSVWARAGKSILSGRPIGDATENTGKAIYKSAPAFRAPDYNNKALGKRPISDIGLEQGIWGRASTMPEQFDKAQRGVGQELGVLEDEASRLGVRGETAQDLRPSMNEALKRADIDPLTGRPRINPSSSMDPQQRRAAAQVVGELQREALLNPKPPISRMIENKQTYARKAQPEYKLDPKHTARSELDEGIAHDYRTAIEDLADQGKKGLGGEIYKANRDYGSIEEARKSLHTSGRQKVNLAPQPRDLPLGLLGAISAGMGGGSGPGMLAAATAAAGAGKLAGSNMGRTSLGLILNKLGKTGLLDPAMRMASQQYFEQQNIQRPNPWSLYQQDGESVK